MLTKRILTIIISECIVVKPSVFNQVWSSILTPIKSNSNANPGLRKRNIPITFTTIKNMALNPSMAKILEKKTIYGSLVMAKIAGIESTAKITSENSITISTINNGVMYSLPSFRTRK